MKNFPKPYADALVMCDVLGFLYSKIEGYEDECAAWATHLQDEPDDEWYRQQIAEASAKAAACQRIVERLGK